MPSANKPTFGIDENRLSFGILILLIVAGVGYGLWQVVEPLIESREVNTEVSRRKIADKHYSDKEYVDSAELYREILNEDPWNGFVIAKLGLAHDQMVERLVIEADAMISRAEPQETTTENDDTGDDVPVEPIDEALLGQLESQIDHHLTQATTEFEKLRDHARFRSWGNWRTIRLYVLKAKRDEDNAWADKAIEATRESLEGGYTWNRMFRSGEIAWLRNFPEYRKLLVKHGIAVRRR